MFGRMAFDSLQQAVPHDMARTFFLVHAFLVHAANVAKLLWSSRNVERGKKLRDKLRISGDWKVGDQSFRHHLEHFDERLDRWASALGDKNLVDMNIMPAGAIVGLDPSTFLRNLDPNSLTFSFAGETYDLGRVAEEMDTISGNAKEWLDSRNTPHFL